MPTTTPTINFELTRGDDFEADVTFDQAVSAFSEIRFTARESWAFDEADNTGATFTVTLTPNGANTALLELPHAATQGWTRDGYFYDIQVTLTSNGKRYTTQRGLISMTPDVTR